MCCVVPDTQAMVVMALACIHSRSELNLDERVLDEMVSELKRKQHKNGTIDNLKTTALVAQVIFFSLFAYNLILNVLNN